MQILLIFMPENMIKINKKQYYLYKLIPIYIEINFPAFFDNFNIFIQFLFAFVYCLPFET